MAQQIHVGHWALVSPLPSLPIHHIPVHQALESPLPDPPTPQVPRPSSSLLEQVSNPSPSPEPQSPKPRWDAASRVAKRKLKASMAYKAKQRYSRPERPVDKPYTPRSPEARKPSFSKKGEQFGPRLLERRPELLERPVTIPGAGPVALGICQGPQHHFTVQGLVLLRQFCLGRDMPQWNFLRCSSGLQV